MSTATGDLVSLRNRNSLPVVDSVSSSGSGGGPSDGESGMTPGETVTATSPTSTIVQSKSFADIQTQTEPYHSFSAKTCLELLSENKLSDDQLLFEQMYFELLRHEFTKLRSAQNIKFKAASIQRQLSSLLIRQSSDDFNGALVSIQTLTDSLSCLAQAAQSEMDKVRSPVALTPHEDTDCSVPAPVPAPRMKTQKVNPQPPSTVCQFVDCDFTDLDVVNILEDFPINKKLRCGRQTAYFGALPYSYGTVRHEAKPYPTCNTFKTLFERLRSVQDDITPFNYTCLVTLYNNGSDYIPMHSDNELVIDRNSNIYTVSIGASRVMRFANKTETFDCVLPHGSTLSMPVVSQDSWSHGILQDPVVSNPRVSFTFRRMTNSPPLPVSQHKTHHTHHVTAPVSTTAVQFNPPPGHSETTPVHSTASRGILFLTDSIYKHTPETALSGINGSNLKCTKQVNYRLEQVFDHEPQFARSEIVIISCGVNDLSRYNHTPQTLSETVVPRLKLACAKNPGTNFVFSAILSTRLKWLNNWIGQFNNIMFELAAEIPNLFFFDSHSVLLHQAKQQRTSVFRDNVHITDDARRYVISHLTTGIKFLLSIMWCRFSTARGLSRVWSWPLRPCFHERQLIGAIPRA